MVMNRSPFEFTIERKGFIILQHLPYLQIEQQIHSKFSGIILKKPLFYENQYALRFEIGGSGPLWSKPYMQQAEHRSKAIFRAIFQPDDQILLKINNYQKYNQHSSPKIYSKYIKRRNDQLVSLSYQVQQDDEDRGIFSEWLTHKYIYQGICSSFHWQQILKNIIQYESPYHPTRSFGPTIFFHPTKQIAYHLYDDRGLDIVATSKEAIRPLYYQFHDWLLDYDRPRMDANFQGDQTI